MKCISVLYAILIHAIDKGAEKERCIDLIRYHSATMNTCCNFQRLHNIMSIVQATGVEEEEQ